MLNIKAVIQQLRSEDYSEIEKQLLSNKADNMLTLLKAYKEDKQSDKEIIQQLNCSENSFYTLKSRLYDKIQAALSENSAGHKSVILNQLSEIPLLCFNTPRETAEAILNKLEIDLKAYNMLGDLISVYSALKKIHLYTPKYYTYSQLYNKHLAYTVALEKAEELLGNFTKTLSQYHLSKSPELLEFLFKIKEEVNNIFLLNNSPNVEVIQNIIIIQLQLFTDTCKENEAATEDLLNSTTGIIEKFNSNAFQYHELMLSFFKCEYYSQIGQYKKAEIHFNEVNGAIDKWLLLDNSCIAYLFLFLKINTYCRENKQEQLDIENASQALIYDVNNPHTKINVQLYYAISKFYAGKYKESKTILNDILNSSGYKGILHAEIEVKLTLAYIYVKQEDFELASVLLKSITRKIKAQTQYKYENAIYFSKLLFQLMDSDKSSADKAKIIKYIRLFEFENTGKDKILQFFKSEFERLKQKYAGN